ncbi:hypothetical protein HYN59_03880 [Flavobacterium album]|uniref:Uncharacterized protein n=1 Tax=Flavobacterium album TaxID=2175091 RepID=A0A2S1QV97_9FLAO|nr:hypothetical protein [Flavobacterium album]AWH84306.1 hypothetical protein HYN59_03880 [Flavobacterium album]
MKKIYLSAVMLLVMIIGNAQDRVDVALPKINKTTIGKLIAAKGWTQGSTGQWDYRTNKLDGDNFLYYELHDVMIGDSSYSIFIQKYTSGYYDYPNIQEGWHQTMAIKYFVFDTKELEKLKNPEADKTTSTSIPVLYRGDMPISATEFSVAKRIEEDLAKEILKNEKPIYDHLIIKIRPYKDTIRFVFKEASAYEVDKVQATDITNAYYEVPREKFSKLFKI